MAEFGKNSYRPLMQMAGLTRHPFGDGATEILLDRADISSQSRVLIVGGGLGHTGAFIAKKYGSMVHVLDPSEKVLEQAKALYRDEAFFSQMEFSLINDDTWPFADAYFDLVLCESFLIFVEDKLRILSEIERILKPSAYLAINELCFNESDDFKQLREDFSHMDLGLHVATARTLIDSLASDKFSVVVHDEKPMDMSSHFKVDFVQLLSKQSGLLALEMAHQVMVDKSLRNDLLSFMKLLLSSPKEVLSCLNYLLLLMRKNK